MAYAAVQLLSTPFEDYAGWWLKFFNQGTVTPLSMATDATGGTLIAQAEISSGGTVPLGFFSTTGPALLRPYVDGAYDAWIFPTEAEATANDTTNAIQISDNVNADFDQGLRADLADTTAGKGASLVVFESGDTVQDLAETVDTTQGDNLVTHPAKIYTTEFLQTVSDINNGVPISIMRFITTASGEHGKIRARTTTTDHTTDFNDAITELNAVGGGKVIVPTGDYNVEDLVPKTGVTIQGEIIGVMTGGQSNGSRFVSLGNGSHIFNQSAGTVFNFSIDGMAFRGPGALVAGRGIYGLNLGRFNLSNVNFNNFADEAVKLDAGTASVFSNIFAQNCLLNTVRAAKIGVIDITANDCHFDTIEATASLGSAASVNLYLAAFNIAGSNHFGKGLIGEISDVGFHLTCDNSRFSICRADLNQGHGWELAGAATNRFMGCSGTRNSQDTNDTYNQWEVDSASNSNRFVGCNGDSLGADANKAKYGFNDAFNSDASKNIYDDCTAALNVTKQFNISAAAGSAVSFPSGGPPKSFTAADATPSVEQYCFFKTGAADTYTDFDDGAPGQQIQILAVHAATLTNGVNIFTNTGANKVMVVNRIYTLRDVNGIWYEVE
jgi:hypothetical protein